MKIVANHPSDSTPGPHRGGAARQGGSSEVRAEIKEERWQAFGWRLLGTIPMVLVAIGLFGLMIMYAPLAGWTDGPQPPPQDLLVEISKVMFFLLGPVVCLWIPSRISLVIGFGMILATGYYDFRWTMIDSHPPSLAGTPLLLPLALWIVGAWGLWRILTRQAHRRRA